MRTTHLVTTHVPQAFDQRDQHGLHLSQIKRKLARASQSFDQRADLYPFIPYLAHGFSYHDPPWDPLGLQIPQLFGKVIPTRKVSPRVRSVRILCEAKKVARDVNQRRGLWVQSSAHVCFALAPGTQRPLLPRSAGRQGPPPGAGIGKTWRREVT